MNTTRPSSNTLFRIILGAGACVLVLAGLSIGASLINPILISLFLIVLLYPIYGWLLQRMKTGFALLMMFIGIVICAMLLGGLFLWAISELTATLSVYSEGFKENLANLSENLASVGINIDPSTAFSEEDFANFVGFMISTLVAILSTMLMIVLLVVFGLADGGNAWQRVVGGVGRDNYFIQRMNNVGTSMIRYFAIRTKVNAITGVAFGLSLFVLGIDLAVVWGVLAFFLSYVPYLGITVATIPPTLLAFAEYGAGRALLVILAMAVINLTAENLVAPTMMGRGLNISPYLVFAAFFFWAGILGTAGVFLAMPLTIIIVMILASFEETRWMAWLAGFPNDDETDDGSNLVEAESDNSEATAV